MVSFLSITASISSCLFDLFMKDRDRWYDMICIGDDENIITITIKITNV